MSSTSQLVVVVVMSYDTQCKILQQLQNCMQENLMREELIKVKASD